MALPGSGYLPDSAGMGVSNPRAHLEDGELGPGEIEEETRGAQRETLILMRGPRTNPRETSLMICESAEVGEGKNLPGRGSNSCKGQR